MNQSGEDAEKSEEDEIVKVKPKKKIKTSKIEEL